MNSNPSRAQGEYLPVESVSWDDCRGYCARLGHRVEGLQFGLPTEVQWEYACRAGTQSAFHDGSPCTQPHGKDPALDQLGWFAENSGVKTHPVAEKLPNEWGLYDMLGNVWEWCRDDLRSYRNRSEVSPGEELGADARRVVRGGCAWFSARLCRSAYRLAYEPGFRDEDLGFRFAAGLAHGSGAEEPQAGGADAPGPEAPAGGFSRGAEPHKSSATAKTK